MARVVKIRTDGRIWCAGCEEYLTAYRFGKYRGAKPPSRCKKCRSAAAHEKMIAATYGLTADAYQMLLDYQGGLCAICRRPSKVRRLAVDHDHATGLVRGLLCRTCNYDLLGRIARDDVTVLQRAVAYLLLPPLARIAKGLPSDV